VKCVSKSQKGIALCIVTHCCCCCSYTGRERDKEQEMPDEVIAIESAYHDGANKEEPEQGIASKATSLQVSL